MIRFASVRTALATLLLGSALALPGLQMAHAHAAPAHQSGPVLAGTWLNLTPGAPFSNLQITAVTTSALGAAVPTSITYGVNVFSITANRFVAFGVSSPVPFTAAEVATVPLTALPTPSRFFSTTITLSLVSSSSIRVDIRDHSRIFGDRFSVEFMHR